VKAQQLQGRTKRRHPPRPPFNLHPTWNPFVTQTITNSGHFIILSLRIAARKLTCGKAIVHSLVAVVSQEVLKWRVKRGKSCLRVEQIRVHQDETVLRLEINEQRIGN
jgi:hypothetical protein